MLKKRMNRSAIHSTQSFTHISFRGDKEYSHRTAVHFPCPVTFTHTGKFILPGKIVVHCINFHDFRKIPHDKVSPNVIGRNRSETVINKVAISLHKFTDYNKNSDICVFHRKLLDHFSYQAQRLPHQTKHILGKDTEFST